MIATLVYVDVKPEYIEEFRAASIDNHDNSRKEKGNIRFDVLQDAAVPTSFILYEVFEDEAAVLAHKETEHYKRWRDTVAPYMNSARRATKTAPVAFD